MSPFFYILQERSIADKKESQIDFKVLDEAILKSLAYKPEKKRKAKAAPNSESGPRK